MTMKSIQIPSNVIAYARRVYPNNPKKVVKALLELALNQTLDFSPGMLSDDEVARQIFSNEADSRLVDSIVRWFLNNDGTFNNLINSYGLSKVSFTYEDGDFDNNFMITPLLVLTVKE